jgi:outer membrane receptor protein involved in Fe transport
MNQQLGNPQFAKKAIVLAMAAVFAAPAGAQQDSRAIEEIIVTATKRAEDIQDIGLSITALDADGMARFGIVDVTRLGFAVAGLTYANAGNDAKLNLRGANSTNTFSDNGSIIAAYVDGVFKPHASMQTRAFFDVERLEFIKGPQGTLYGRNTFAGALNLYTNKPDTERVAGSITASFESFDTFRTEGFVNLPVNDTNALRLAAYYENGDGHINNNAGQNAGKPNNLGARLSWLIAPSDNLDFLFRATYIQEQGTSVGLFGYKNTCRQVNADGITDAFGTVTDCQNPQRGGSQVPTGDTGPYEISQDFLPDMDVHETVVSLDINWDVGSVAIKSITAFTDFTNEVGFDFDFSPTNHQPGGFDDYAESFSQEIHVSSNNDSPFQWTGGVYYSKDESQYAFWIYNSTVRDDSTRTTDPNTGLIVLDGTFLVDGATSLNGPFADNHSIEATTTGVFFHGEFSVTDSLRLIAGARYTEEDKEAFAGGSNFSGTGLITPRFTEGDSPLIVPSTRLEAFDYDLSVPGTNNSQRTYDNTTWTAGIEYNFNDDMMIYGTASTGFVGGAMNYFGACDPTTGDPLDISACTDEQESEMFEVGFKSILMDGSLLFNLSYHDTEYSNLVAQFQTLNALGQTITISINSGIIEASGVELELQWVPTDEWSLGLTAAFLDATFGDFGQTSPYQLNRGVPTTFESVKGETPGWSPEFVLNFFAEYHFSLANGGTLTPAIYFASSDAYNTSNLYSLDPNHDQDSFTKTDLRLTWGSADGKYAAAVYVENLEDEAVLSRGNNGSQGNVQTGFLYPRNYGVSFQVRW